MILEKIVRDKKIELERQKENFPLDILERQISKLFPTRNFKDSFKKRDFGLIAEIKKASPSAGIICKDFNPVELAKIYEQNGVSATSVITENNYFYGSLNFLKIVRGVTSIPVLRKDFIFDEYQIYESRVAEADAVLLIVAILTDKILIKLLNLAREMGLDALVETHTEEEIERALKSGAEIIGINNRDLNTFKVDITKSIKLSHLIPPDKIVVSESGIRDRADMVRLENSGVDAALVGETIMKSEDVGKKVRELLGKN
ncbi:MAG TPA: indole-3-glycerol phosphate synthase TrpC [Actinobacteria bacterium]|nr:indole-3-glycerol phosphate synthase TrpC [Actinomycetota bacterium]